MRKTLLTLFTASLFFSSASVLASLELDMVILQGGLRTATNTDDIAEFKKALTDMRAAAEDAKTQMPDKLKDQPAGSPEIKDYQAGINKLIGQIDISRELAEAGDLAGAKKAAEKLAAIRNENHQKFR